MEGICNLQEHLVCVASMVKLLCLMINLPSCGWSEEFPRSCSEDGGSMLFQNNGRLYNITVEKTVIFIDTNTVCKFKIFNLFILTEKYTSTSTVTSS